MTTKSGESCANCGRPTFIVGVPLCARCENAGVSLPTIAARQDEEASYDPSIDYDGEAERDYDEEFEADRAADAYERAFERRFDR